MKNMYLEEFEKLQEQLDEMMKAEHPDLDALLKVGARLDKHIERIMKKA